VGVEIERKFLVVDDTWRGAVVDELVMEQGYLSTAPEQTIRVRRVGEQGTLTIKGRATGIVRPEFEVEIPALMARELLAQFCADKTLTKIRYLVDAEGHRWEVDVFDGENRGLVVAEVELQHPDEEVVLPDFVGREVTGRPEYYNARLVERPFQTWQKES
jgi:adenylate cyclase